MDTTPTDRQLEFCRNLLAERKGVAAAEAIRAELNETARRTGAMPSRQEVSSAIDRLLKVAKPARPVTVDVEFANVPKGRYAFTATDGHVAFAKVWVARTGRRGVDLLIGAPGDWRQETLSRTAAHTVLEQIATDPEGHARLFGQKTRSCGNCGSPLTDPQSRAAGYGGTCAENNGFWYPTREEALRLLDETEGPESFETSNVGRALIDMAAEPVGVSGLTLPEIVAQSRACHPDWDAADHALYLIGEEGINVRVAELAKRFGLTNPDSAPADDTWSSAPRGAPKPPAPVTPQPSTLRVASEATDPSQLDPELVRRALAGVRR